MFILKNAMISITRNKGRNILIGSIIFVIACACTVTLAINKAASDLINSYQSAYDKELTISFNRENMMKDIDFSDRDKMSEKKDKFNNISSLSVEDIKNYAESNHIESYYYTYQIGLNGSSISKAESETNNNFPGGGFPGGGKGGFRESNSDFTLTGYSSIEAMSEFIEGTFEMVEITDNAWEVAFDGNYVFINEELASYNSLSLNDKITLSDDNGNLYEFTIIGIYKENESGVSSPMSMFASSVNTIITNANALENIDVKGNITPTFIIDDYENAEKIQEEFYERGLDENYVVETNEEEATAGLTSVKNVKNFASTFLIITLLIGGTVLFIINMINIRERKYEIGVLRTIGLSKTKLTLQFVSELLIVGFAALMIGAGVGATMSKGISNSLLSSEINSSNESSEKIRNNFGGPMGNMPDFKDMNDSFKNFDKKGTPKVEAYESIDAVVSIGVLLELLAIGVSLILVSSLSAMISIQRFSPLTILKERS